MWSSLGKAGPVAEAMFWVDASITSMATGGSSINLQGLHQTDGHISHLQGGHVVELGDIINHRGTSTGLHCTLQAAGRQQAAVHQVHEVRLFWSTFGASRRQLLQQAPVTQLAGHEELASTGNTFFLTEMLRILGFWWNPGIFKDHLFFHDVFHIFLSLLLLLCFRHFGGLHIRSRGPRSSCLLQLLILFVPNSVAISPPWSCRAHLRTVQRVVVLGKPWQLLHPYPLRWDGNCWQFVRRWPHLVHHQSLERRPVGIKELKWKIMKQTVLSFDVCTIHQIHDECCDSIGDKSSWIASSSKPC